VEIGVVARSEAGPPAWAAAEAEWAAGRSTLPMTSHPFSLPDKHAGHTL